MEAHQQQLQQVLHPNDDEEGGNKINSSFVCRQSSTRWSPTTEQIRILKELYYNNGVRSPSADQIQRISARLRQYGKIEGKNVFYWFQNHKARERQKKRFTTTTDHHHHMNIINIPTMQQQRGSSGWRSDHQVQDPLYNNKYPNIISTSTTPSGVPSPSSSSSSSSPSVIGVGQMGGYGYGSATMERRFRDCSISRGGGSIGHNFGWVGVDSYSKPYPFLDQRKSVDETLEEEQEDQPPQIETLSLFPMHRAGDIKPESDAYHNATSWYISDDGKGSSCSTSLDLSLNSYTGS